MSTAIIDATNIDLSVLSYGVPKANPTGGKVVNLYNKNVKESLTLAMPLMGAWGAQEVLQVVGKGPDGKPITEGTGKYTLSLQFAKGQYTSPEADATLQQLKLLEDKIKDDAMANSMAWFGKEIKLKEVIEEKFNPMLRYPKIKGTQVLNYDEPPSLSVKLPCWKNVWQTSVFDEDYNPLYVKGKTELLTPLNFLENQSKAPMQVVALIQCAGLWFVNSKVSVTWNLKQVIVKKPKMSSIADDTCFLTVRPSDMAVLKSLPEKELNQSDDIISTIVEESDDEPDALPAVTLPAPAPVVVAEPTPAPVPTPVAVAEPVAEKKKTKVIKKSSKE